jgi:penicillin-binding protein 2
MLKKFIKPKRTVRFHDPFCIKTGQMKNRKMDTSYRSGWAEEAFISDSRERETIGNNFNPGKIPIIGLISSFFIILILSKTYWLQIANGEYYHSMAEGNRIRIQRIEPKRGVIYDSHKRVVARNRPNFMLYFVPADLPVDEELENILDRINEILPETQKESMLEKISKVGRRSLEAYVPLYIVDDIEYEKAMTLYLESEKWQGVILTNKSKREYPVYGLSEGEEEKYYLSLSHILGYTGKINQKELESYGKEYLPIDYIGKMGIEYFWENELKGISGKKQIEVDALGKEKKVLGEEKQVDGNNLVLSLDIMQQIKLEEIILRHLEKLETNRASAIIMDPRNGEIKAMVSLPAYNNNLFARGITQEEYSALNNDPEKPFLNRCVSGEYPSGSTIKPVMSAAALQDGIITENTSIMSTGGVRISQWFFPDWRAGGHGATNVKKAIADSVNTFYYYIGGGFDDFRGLGVDRITEYMSLFGLGRQTGIDIAGEAGGFLPSKEWKKEVKKENWYIGDTYHLSIGQGDLLATPLQVAAFTCVFANGGRLERPRFIRYILSSDEKYTQEVPAESVRENFIDKKNIDIVRAGMRQTVTSGSARRLNDLPVSAAGKTGTAQWSSKKPNHAWFTGFAPYEDPELVITVLVEEGGEGSEVAVPIAEEFLRWYYGEYKEE